MLPVSLDFPFFIFPPVFCNVYLCCRYIVPYFPIFLFFCVVLLCVFTFWVPCYDVRYDFRIKIMFGSSLTPVVWRRACVIDSLFVFVCAQWRPTHIVLCFALFVFILCTRRCQFLWIVHCWLPLRFSLAFN